MAGLEPEDICSLDDRRAKQIMARRRFEWWWEVNARAAWESVLDHLISWAVGQDLGDGPMPNQRSIRQATIAAIRGRDYRLPAPDMLSIDANGQVMLHREVDDGERVLLLQSEGPPVKIIIREGKEVKRQEVPEARFD